MTKENRPQADATTLRVRSLDVLRGVAIVGTLLTNIWIFTGSYGGDETSYILPGRFEEYLVPLSTAISNGKFLGLLSILFGVGIAIQFDSALRHGYRWPWRYEWRSLLLLADGFIHFTLVVSFDILMGYALTAMVIAPLLLLRTRWLAVATLLAGALHLALELRRLLGDWSIDKTGRGDLPEGFDRDLDRADLTDLRGSDVPMSYVDEVVGRVANFWAERQEAFVIAPPLSAFLFLAGALLWRAGLFKGDARAHTLSRRLAVGGLAVGVPLTVWGLLDLPGSDYLSGLSRYTVAPIVAFGYLGLILILLRRRGGSGFLSRRLADVGRTALSCYMLQNVIAIVLFYEYGLGLGPLGPLGTVLAWAGISGLLMLGAWVWLRRFSQGPFELVWRWGVDAPFRRADRRRQDMREENEKRTKANDETAVGAP